MSSETAGDTESQAALAVATYLLNRLGNISSRNRCKFRLIGQINRRFQKPNTENVGTSQNFTSFSRAASARLIRGSAGSL